MIGRLFRKIRLVHVGYVFLTFMILNVIVPNILRLSGVEVIFDNSARITLVLQLIGIPILAWILGWVNGSKYDGKD